MGYGLEKKYLQISGILSKYFSGKNFVKSILKIISEFCRDYDVVFERMKNHFYNCKFKRMRRLIYLCKKIQDYKLNKLNRKIIFFIVACHYFIDEKIEIINFDDYEINFNDEFKTLITKIKQNLDFYDYFIIDRNESKEPESLVYNLDEYSFNTKNFEKHQFLQERPNFILKILRSY